MTSPSSEEENSAGFVFWLRFWCRVVAAVEVIGGIVGLYDVVFGSFTGNSRIVFLLSFVFFVASIWGGLLLAFGKKGGVSVSLILQILQLVQVSTATFLWSFICGMGLVIGSRPTNDGQYWSLSWLYGARFFLFINPLPSDTTTGVNVVAALAIICLFWARAEKQKCRELDNTIRKIQVQDKPVWPPPPESPTG